MKAFKRKVEKEGFMQLNAKKLTHIKMAFIIIIKTWFGGIICAPEVPIESYIFLYYYCRFKTYKISFENISALYMHYLFHIFHLLHMIVLGLCGIPSISVERGLHSRAILLLLIAKSRNHSHRYSIWFHFTLCRPPFQIFFFLIANL